MPTIIKAANRFQGNDERMEAPQTILESSNEPEEIITIVDEEVENG